MAIDATAIGMEIWKWATRLIIGLGVIGIGYVIALWWNRNKRYNWIVRIFNKDAIGNVIQQPDDKGGVFMDKKTQYRLFLVKKIKFGLDPDVIPYILTSKGQKIVYLLQTGLKNYQFMKPSISDNPGLTFGVQDEDVAWALNAYERNKKAFENTFLQQIMPIVGMAFVFLLIVVSMYYIFRNFGVLSEVAQSFNEAAKEFAKVQLGTTVVQGGGG